MNPTPQARTNVVRGAALVAVLALVIGALAFATPSLSPAAPSADPISDAQPGLVPAADVDADGTGDADDGDGDGDDQFDLDQADPESVITPDGVKAIKRGLAFLAEQQADNGSITNRGSSNYVVAFTALSTIALIAGGHVPGRGQHGDIVRKAVEYLMAQQKESGFISGPQDGSRIHGHGYATQCLAQVYGMVRDAELETQLKRVIRKAVRLIENSQTREGGWGYDPEPGTFDEASTTVCQVHALRMARDAGISVDREVIDDAIEYVHRSAMRTDWTDKDGASHIGYTFKYSLAMQSSRSTFPLTAAAVSTLHGAGRYTDEVLEGGLGWINAFFHNSMQAPPNQQWYDRFFYYAHFYAAQAFYHAEDRSYWNNYYPKIRNYLLERQNRANGSWPSDYQEIYGTATATLILQIPYKYLPLFQR